ncbi:unnamed protein product [Phytophthora fragariaefolia]|uniref:Unnamed protein product n=1 Tax=Phytophthora fragariaefolia TaxID=1490495 RepID=A0A9W6XBD7_9STRA|nr:unnamed protein product [Phytophthora fragariaefolia]
MNEVNKKVNVQHVGYDHEMTLVANLVSEHACESIHNQYSYALERVSYDFYEDFPNVYYTTSSSENDDALGERSVKYSISKRDWTCSCLLMSTRLLPCRHKVARQVKKDDFSRASQSVLCVAESDSEVDIAPTASDSDVEIVELQSDISLPSTQVVADRVTTVITLSRSGESGEPGNKLGNQSGEADSTLGDESQEMTTRRLNK